jgi:hypothetical protein
MPAWIEWEAQLGSGELKGTFLCARACAPVIHTPVVVCRNDSQLLSEFVSQFNFASVPVVDAMRSGSCRVAVFAADLVGDSLDGWWACRQFCEHMSLCGDSYAIGRVIQGWAVCKHAGVIVCLD